MKIGTTGHLVLNTEQYLINQELAQAVDSGVPQEYFLLPVEVVAEREEEGQLFYFVALRNTKGLAEFLKKNGGVKMLGTCRNGSIGEYREIMGWYTDYELESDFEYAERLSSRKV